MESPAGLDPPGFLTMSVVPSPVARKPLHNYRSLA